VQATYGAEHPQTAYYLDRLASALDAAGRQSEADLSRAKATAMRKQFRHAAASRGQGPSAGALVMRRGSVRLVRPHV
jgi:hypothetical protein